jgi:hypothetical protein
MADHLQELLEREVARPLPEEVFRTVETREPGHWLGQPGGSDSGVCLNTVGSRFRSGVAGNLAHDFRFPSRTLRCLRHHIVGSDRRRCDSSPPIAPRGQFFHYGTLSD